MNNYRRQNHSRNRKPHARYSSAPTRSAKGGPFWLICGLLLGIVAAGGLYVKFYGIGFIDSYVTRYFPQDNTVAIRASVKKELKDQQPRFDFYTMLPNQEMGNLPDQDPRVQEALASQNNSSKASAEAPAAVAPAPTAVATASPAANPVVAAADAAPKPVEPSTQLTTTETPKPDKPISSETKEKSAANRFILQIGAFQKQAQAERIKAELALMGFSVVVLPTPSTKGTIYRVAVGPYSSPSSANHEQQRLLANNIKSILRKIPG